MLPQFPSTAVTVVTNCTSRKRLLGGAVLLPDTTQACTVEELSARWVDAAGRVRSRCPASELYQGRSFQDALVASALAGAELRVVSAGFGLVPSDAPLPHYNLTISSGEGSIKQWLAARNLTASDWWTALTFAWRQERPLRHLLANNHNQVVLLALPSTYLAMLSDELASIDAVHTASLRILTSGAGARLLPKHLLSARMPYDERLDSIPGYAGTKADFPQRALRHFIEVLQGHRLPARTAERRVEQALETQITPVRPIRAKVSDEEIAALLRAQWVNLGGSSTKLLRYLRDSAHVACEQNRFRTLWLSMKANEG